MVLPNTNLLGSNDHQHLLEYVSSTIDQNTGNGYTFLINPDSKKRIEIIQRIDNIKESIAPNDMEMFVDTDVLPIADDNGYILTDTLLDNSKIDRLPIF